MPTRYSLGGNHPNPFGAETTIHIVLPRQSHLTLEVVDPAGRHIRLLMNGVHGPGRYAVRWDGTDASGRAVVDGRYVCRMVARSPGGSTFMQSREMILARGLGELPVLSEREAVSRQT